MLFIIYSMRWLWRFDLSINLCIGNSFPLIWVVDCISSNSDHSRLFLLCVPQPTVGVFQCSFLRYSPISPIPSAILLPWGIQLLLTCSCLSNLNTLTVRLPRYLNVEVLWRFQTQELDILYYFLSSKSCVVLPMLSLHSLVAREKAVISAQGRKLGFNSWCHFSLRATNC